MAAFVVPNGLARLHDVASAPSVPLIGAVAPLPSDCRWSHPAKASSASAMAPVALACVAMSRRVRLPRRVQRGVATLARDAFRGEGMRAAGAASNVAVGAAGGERAAAVRTPPEQAVEEALGDVRDAAIDTASPHWSDAPMKESSKGVPMEKLDWPNLHGLSCVASGILFLGELVRFVVGIPPTDIECYIAAVVYAVIYATRFNAIRGLPSHFRVTFYATTGWTIYYIAHLLAATNPAVFAGGVYSTGIVYLASTIYFYKHWIERMWRHYVEDRFRAYYMPGLLGLMYFHTLDVIDLFNQWLDPHYWYHIVLTLPDQVWTVQDVRLTGLFMSSMALFMITLHNKGVLTGGSNTLITVLFTIFVPAFFLTGTHATLQASFP